MYFATTRRRFLSLLSSLAVSSRFERNAMGDTATSTPSNQHGSDSSLLIWLQQPAAKWVDALPLGNGRLGAMVFGGVRQERIALNEDTLWSGYPRDWNNTAAQKSLPVVRRMVFEEKDYHGADQECHKMQGPFNQAFQPLGDLLIDFEHRGDATSYRRELNLDTAIATTSYVADGIQYTREVFVSAPAQLVVIHLSCSKARALKCVLRFRSQLHGRSLGGDANQIQFRGKAPSQSDPNYKQSSDPVQYDDTAGKGMHFASVLEVRSPDGDVRQNEDGSMSLQDATSALIVIGMATGYKTYAALPDRPLEAVVAMASHPISATRRLSYAQLRQLHIADHRGLFRRVSLDLEEDTSTSNLPTDKRLSSVKDSFDPSLLALYFNYGRYLLIASSRPGTQPANLQGIWNEELRPPWSSNWTSNINVQMNYWLAETCNLSECHLPLFEMTRDLSENGRLTAKTNYGAQGWVSHHNIDLWRQSAPVGDYVADPTWANFCMSGPWLCAHLWEHYRFSNDRAFLRDTAYPVMKGSAEYCLNWLVEDDRGRLTTCPSVSTENLFLAADGKPASVSAGCTLDLAFIRELFANVMQAATNLGVDRPFVERLASTLERLPKYQIGGYGQLQEWSEDFPENDPGHRHMSHLYTVYPGAEITPHKNAALVVPARKSLERRLAHGGGATGWSCVWAVSLWARFQDGDMALQSLRKLVTTNTGVNLFNVDFWDQKHLFQIDANFGAAAGIAEMLLQSHDSEISFLPALPKAWNRGSVRGLRARGGMEVSIAWAHGAADSATVHASSSGRHVFCAPKGQQITGVKRSRAGQWSSIPHTNVDTQRAEVEVAAGETYRFQFSLA